MLRIKLSRRGKKKQPVYRIIVTERAKDPWGDYLENVGTWNPRTTPNTLTLKEDRVKHWLSVGAKPTDTVHNLLVDAGMITTKKVRASNLGRKFKDNVKAEAEKAKEERLAAADAKKAEADAPKEEAPKEEAPKVEAKAEEPKAEEKPAKEEPKKEEKKEEKPKEEAPKEEKKAE
jgi:small subunit ribosomal protein S16